MRCRSILTRLSLLLVWLFVAVTGRVSAATVTLTASENNTILSDGPSLSNGGAAYLFCGLTTHAGLRRALIAFNLTSAIPIGSTINSASLALNLSKSASNVSTVNVKMHRLTTPWGEAGSGIGTRGGAGAPAQIGDATWTYSFYQSAMWNVVGGDFVAASSASTPVNAASLTGASNLYTWSGAGLTADVQAWANNPNINFGWIALGDEVDASTALRFDSRENTDSAGEVPMLTVDFTPPASPGQITFSSTAYQIEPLNRNGQPNTLPITLFRANGVTGAVSVGVSVSGGSLTNGSDYSFNTPVSFADGASVATVNLQLSALTAAQLPGTINLTLANPTGGATLGTQSSAAITVDSAGAVVFNAATFQFDPLNIAHQPNNLAIGLTRSGGTAGSVSVTATATGGSLVNRTDYTITAPVVFADGAASATLQIQLTKLNPTQLPGTIQLALTAPTGDASLGPQSTATLTILSPGMVQFVASASTLSPTNANGHGSQLSIPLQRVGGTAGSIVASVIVSDGTLVQGNDFQFSPGNQIAFADGSTTGSVGIQVLSSSPGQPQGTIALTIQSVSNDGNVGSPATTLLTLAPTGFASFDAAAYGIDENASSDAMLTVAVDRVGGSTGAVVVGVAVGGGTAVAGTDFNLPSTPVTLSWADGDAAPKAFKVTILPGTLPINSTAIKTLALQLQNSVGGLGILAPSTTTITIASYDSISPTQTLTVPAPNAVIVGSGVTFRGEAKDNRQVDRVEIALDGGVPQRLSPTTATSDFKWSLTARPEQGAHSVAVQAFDAQGNASSLITRRFTFANLRPALAGNYHGLIVAAPEGASEPFNSNGLLAITVTATGSFTGRATLGGEAFALTGVFLNDGAAGFGRGLTSTFPLLKPGRPDGIFLGQLALTLDTGAGHVITGAVSDATSNNPLATIPHADQALYTSRPNPLPPFRNVPLSVLNPSRERGRYTAIFQPEPAPNHGLPADQFPQGSGYAFLNVNRNGGALLTGKLPDGTPISASNDLSIANTLPVFISLYRNTGFFSGTVTFDSTQGETDADGPGMLWLKPSGLGGQGYYPSGWPAGIAADLLASKYLPPGQPSARNPAPPLNPNTVLGIPGAASPRIANLTVSLSAGDLAPGESNDASIDRESRVTVLGATAGYTGIVGLNTIFDALPSLLTESSGRRPNVALEVAPLSGLFTGSFIHPLSGRAIPFEGIALQKTNSAAGFFLFAPRKASLLSAPPASGGVALAPKH